MAIIGRASVRSAAGIARVYVDTWRSSYAGILPDKTLIGMSQERQTSEWAWLIRNRTESQTVLVASEIGHGVVGMASCGLGRGGDRPSAGLYAGGEGAKVGEVFTLYVLPEFQERGIGRQLLAAAFGALNERGCERAFLWVIASNPSQFFYERVGGRRIANRTERLWGADLDQTAYGWSDLKEAIAKFGSYSAN
jgi:ribosomal protein S18 acetylase RimI-like enzyme